MDFYTEIMYYLHNQPLQVAEDLERDRDVIRQVKEEQMKRFEAMKEERRKRNSESNTMATSMNNSSR